MDVLQRLLDGPVGGDGHQLGRHETAGGVGGIAQQQLQALARRGAQVLEIAGALLLRQGAEHFRLLVGGQGVDELRRSRVVDLAEDRVAIVELRLVEHGDCQVERQRTQDHRRRLGPEFPEQLGEVHAAQAGHSFGELDRVAGQQVQELGREHGGAGRGNGSVL
jgi:hypothetical protein